ncbi:rod shape-determining protein MreD [Desulfosudis oleivorans]|uniref:Rod shape-determining protein MreD n=1 Tax=Desulfosudis oleivorans (strain DSM 6200 / JCM 39069 / Hxd3) TaxID=96561 RepID=A8ZU92_DESOH|nr:rod shape-determining protein MreD [Desulfosudis oleivorans]ABW66404.1 hypothetical protein Dole_0594 [Desulfosudis oleivorans Hxd3]
MRYLVCLMVCVLLIVAQSAAPPAYSPLYGLYDWLIPLLIYLAVFRSPVEAGVTALGAGLMMDAVSGGAFGLYLLTYLWIVAGVRISLRFFHGEGVPFLFFAVLAGVLIETLVFWGAGRVAGHAYAFGGSAAGGLARQLVLAGITGPFVVLGFNAVLGQLLIRLDRPV